MITKDDLMFAALAIGVIAFLTVAFVLTFNPAAR